MAIETTYSSARANLSKLMDRVVDDVETVVIRRRNGKGVAMVSLDEWERTNATAYLLASPANRKRLLASLARARRGEGSPVDTKKLRRQLGLTKGE